jgi:hypothetical protein
LAQALVRQLTVQTWAKNSRYPVTAERLADAARDPVFRWRAGPGIGRIGA